MDISRIRLTEAIQYGFVRKIIYLKLLLKMEKCKEE